MNQYPLPTVPQLANWPQPWPLYFFEKTTAPQNESVTEKQKSELEDHGRAVRCAYCKTVVTYQGNAESHSGQHVHSFVNPGGYEFTIACYRKAWCKVMGLPMLEWSWFSGYTWQYALCHQCQEHLGWFYYSASERVSFYGLILDRIIIETGNDRSD